MNVLLRSGAAAMLAAVWSIAAHAGGLSVLPTRIDLGAGKGVQSVLLTNTSAQTVTIESQVVVWPDGAPGQSPGDVVVTPPVVTLPPGQRMRVRIGLLRGGNGAAERAYRLYFTELPAPAPLQGAGIGVRLRIGVPLFVAPTQVRSAALQWTLLQHASGPQLQVHNPGNAHQQLSRIVPAGRSEALPQLSPYLLAGATMTLEWPADLPAGTRVRWLDGHDEHDAVPSPH